jgi:hypothetical protein
MKSASSPHLPRGNTTKTKKTKKYKTKTKPKRTNEKEH